MNSRQIFSWVSMAINHYFAQGSRNEQRLYEDLIVESLKMYGQDVYYIPRETVNLDKLFKDDPSSSFQRAYKIEMYIENTEGFDGEGDIFAKFGVEIRDAATFIVARRRWNSEVVPYESANKDFYRPREGDLIQLPLSNSIFQVMKVEDEQPFYQLKNLPVFRMTCELFEYNEEKFDTDVPEIDNIEDKFAFQNVMTFDTSDITTPWVVGEPVSQTLSDKTMTGKVVRWDGATGKLYVAHIGSNSSKFSKFTTSAAVVGSESGNSATPTLIQELQDINSQEQNLDIETIGNSFIDFSESNPFGDPN
jgi:hypothetical protein